MPPNQGYAPYDTGEAGNHFVKKADGSEFVGIVWPGPAVFPDFTRAKTRDWWGGLYKEFAQNGIAGFWNDMNEPAVFDGPGKTMPLDNVHRIEEPGFATRNATHSEIHNIVGLENARATYEGLLKLRPNERPFVLTRATSPVDNVTDSPGPETIRPPGTTFAWPHSSFSISDSAEFLSSAMISADSTARLHPTCSPGGSRLELSIPCTATTLPRAL